MLFGGFLKNFLIITDPIACMLQIKCFFKPFVDSLYCIAYLFLFYLSVKLSSIGMGAEWFMSWVWKN